MGATDEQEVKPFLDHLEDLRQTLFRCLIAVGVGMAVAFPFTPRILRILTAPLMRGLPDPEPFLQSLEVAGAFTVALRTSLWAGLLLSAPFLVFFIGQFVFPGLKENEKRITLKAGGFAVGLFFLGVVIGYYLTLEVALRIMYGFHDWLGIKAAWRINDYVSFCLNLLLAFGLTFEMPVALVMLGRMGLIRSTQLREKRRHVIVLLLIIAALLTPPDPFTQLAMAIPLILLYEICIWIVRASERRAGQEGEF